MYLAVILIASLLGSIRTVLKHVIKSKRHFHEFLRKCNTMVTPNIIDKQITMDAVGDAYPPAWRAVTSWI